MIYPSSGGFLSSLYFPLNVPLFRPSLGTELHSVQIWFSSLQVRNEELASPMKAGRIPSAV